MGFPVGPVGLCTSNAGGASLIPGQGSRSHVQGSAAKTKKEVYLIYNDSGIQQSDSVIA